MAMFAAVTSDLAKISNDSESAVTLKALALALAERIDSGDANGMALPALSKELRLVLDALSANDETPDDRFTRFLADVSA